MSAPSAIIVGANKGGVGKTTVARALIDYFTILNFNVKAFDTQSPAGNLKRFHPEITEIIDIANTRDQCRLVESFNVPGGLTIVDLRAGSFLRTLDLFRDVGLLDAASNGEVKLLVLHLISASVASLSEVKDTAPFQGSCNFRIVKNFFNDSNFFKENHRFSSAFLRDEDTAKEIHVPRLDPLAYETVELAGLPFSSFVLDQPARNDKRPRSFVLRGYVKTWLERVWDNFESAGLNEFVPTGG